MPCGKHEIFKWFVKRGGKHEVFNAGTLSLRSSRNGTQGSKIRTPSTDGLTAPAYERLHASHLFYLPLAYALCRCYNLYKAYFLFDGILQTSVLKDPQVPASRRLTFFLRLFLKIHALKSLLQHKQGLKKPCGIRRSVNELHGL